MVYFKQLTKNKSLEIQSDVFEGSRTIFGIHFSITHSMDHAGLDFTLDLFKFCFCFKIYDIRHWDDKNNKYIDYDKVDLK